MNFKFHHHLPYLGENIFCKSTHAEILNIYSLSECPRFHETCKGWKRRKRKGTEQTPGITFLIPLFSPPLSQEVFWVWIINSISAFDLSHLWIICASFLLRSIFFLFNICMSPLLKFNIFGYKSDPYFDQQVHSKISEGYVLNRVNFSKTKKVKVLRQKLRTPSGHPNISTAISSIFTYSLSSVFVATNSQGQYLASR